MRKGGTTSLFSYLDQHIDISLPRHKEIFYFSIYHDKPYSWYRSRFPFIWKKGLTGEATPGYLFHPKAPERISAKYPNAKVIFLLRDPVQRAMSNFEMNRKLGWEDAMTFEAAIERELTGTPEIYDFPHGFSKSYTPFTHIHAYLWQGLYAHHLANWYGHFNKGQICILDSHDLFSRPRQTLHRVHDFLGVAHTVPQDLQARNVGSYTNTALPTSLYEEICAYFNKDYSTLRRKYIKNGCDWIDNYIGHEQK